MGEPMTQHRTGVVREPPYTGEGENRFFYVIPSILDAVGPFTFRYHFWTHQPGLVTEEEDHT